ncbi:MAG: MBL fold metallo-hydrolase [Deltaproteobacteria bacterium]|nr:MBL fold metallo-hydrolase [Deltaproteobacteria bacterium]
MKLQFLGAAGTVTGSRHLLEVGKRRFLVDCGMFQGLKTLRLRNWRPFPVPPASIDAVLLTHAHIDHSGYLPVLVREGFKGPIYCTAPTRDLCNILLPDSGRIHEEDARYAQRKGFSKHRPALPLYTEEDALRVAERFKTVRFEDELDLHEITATYRSAGHILGASTIEVRSADTSVQFSGDIGGAHDLLMPPAEAPARVEHVVMESTYGDRERPPGDPIELLGDIVRETVKRDGVLLIPAFAVGRSQNLLYALRKVFDRKLAPQVPVYLNSPMANRVTKLYERYAPYHRLNQGEYEDICDPVTFVGSVEESIELNSRKGPMIVISASGMITGGRILHHIRAFGGNPKNTILLMGYQAPGTRGASLEAGERRLKIHGDYVEIRADVQKLDVYSAHADQKELLSWIGKIPEPPRRVFLVHGDPPASDCLRRLIRHRYGFPAQVAEDSAAVDLPVINHDSDSL